MGNRRGGATVERSRLGGVRLVRGSTVRSSRKTVVLETSVKSVAASTATVAISDRSGLVVGKGATAATEVTRGLRIGDDMIQVILESGETFLRLLLEAAIPSQMLENRIASGGFHTFEYVKTHGNRVAALYCWIHR